MHKTEVSCLSLNNVNVVVTIKTQTEKAKKLTGEVVLGDIIASRQAARARQACRRT